jgi:hypothetical protein
MPARVVGPAAGRGRLRDPASFSSSTSAVFISDSRRMSPTRSFMIVCSSPWMA